MKLGIVGLPNVGKSTLFNAITKAGAEAANYPFCTIEPNVGVVTVPDERVTTLSKVYNSKKTIYTTIEFSDIAGLVKGASKGEGLGNKFLGHIREVEAIVHVVRCFDDENVVHVDGRIDPVNDIEVINTELIIADMEVMERRIAKTEKQAKADKSARGELELLKRIYDLLSEGRRAREIDDISDEEAAFVKSLDLLTYKPVIYAANVSEDDASGEDNEYVKAVKEYAEAEGSEVVVISAKVESELAELEDDEREMFLEELGIEESGLDKLIKSSYALLDLISFLILLSLYLGCIFLLILFNFCIPIINSFLSYLIKHILNSYSLWLSTQFIRFISSNNYIKKFFVPVITYCSQSFKSLLLQCLHLIRIPVLLQTYGMIY